MTCDSNKYSFPYFASQKYRVNTSHSIPGPPPYHDQGQQSGVLNIGSNPRLYADLPAASPPSCSNGSEVLSSERSRSIRLSTLKAFFRLLAIVLLATQLAVQHVFCKNQRTRLSSAEENVKKASILLGLVVLAVNIVITCLAFRPLDVLPFRIIISRKENYSRRIAEEATRLAQSPAARNLPALDISSRRKNVRFLDLSSVLLLAVSAILAAAAKSLWSAGLSFIL